MVKSQIWFGFVFLVLLLVSAIADDVLVLADDSLEKEGGEGEATDANKETHVEEKAEKEPEDKEITLEEYEKLLEEKRKSLQATKIEERKVDTKAFKSMQQLSSKKSNNDEVFIKLGMEKDKRTVEKVEKTKKSLSMNELLKPVNGESYRGGYVVKGKDVEVVDQEKEPSNEDHGRRTWREEACSRRT